MHGVGHMRDDHLPTSPPPPATSATFPPPPPACTATTTPGDDGSSGLFWCINGGTVSGMAPNCECQNCGSGFGGANCADANACSASTDESKTTGADGEFWCINRGTIGGSAGECSCTCKTGYSGDHCQTANDCTATDVLSAESSFGSDGTFYCINGGTVGGVTLNCTCTDCNPGYGDDRCMYKQICTASSDESKTTGSDGTFYCINGGTASGLTEDCVCIGCNTGWEGDHCEIAKACSGSRDSSKTTGDDGKYYCEHGTVSGTTESCQCTDCATGYDGTHCQTAKSCTPSSDQDMTSGANGEFYCINGGSIGGVTESCTCTACNAGYGGDHCETAQTCTASTIRRKDRCRRRILLHQRRRSNRYHWRLHVSKLQHSIRRRELRDQRRLLRLDGRVQDDRCRRRILLHQRRHYQWNLGFVRVHMR